MNKKMYLLAMLIGLGFSLVIFFWLKNQTTKLNLPISSPSPDPRVINPQGDTILLENDNFQVVHLPRFNKYIITIFAVPFETGRQGAETALLHLLNLTYEQACQLNVTISTPHYTNPQESRRLYSLSFCHPPSPSPAPPPSLFIDPDLLPLTINSIIPQQGETPLGGTNNAISVYFDQPINPDFALITNNQGTELVGMVRKDNLNKLSIVPKTSWNTDSNYIIVIKAGLMSQDKKYQTKEDIVLNYTITTPPIPIFDREP